MIPSFPSVAKLDNVYHGHYVIYSARKFLFFMDPMHKGKVSIKEMAHSVLSNNFYLIILLLILYVFSCFLLYFIKIILFLFL